jgi:hypothetical protein
MMILWVMALAGIVGGKVFFFAGRWAKAFYLLVLGYLISMLLIVLVPQVLPSPLVLSGEYLFLAKYVLPALLPVMALLPVEHEAEGEAEVVDFVYSAFIFLLLAVLVLGSISAMLLTQAQLFRIAHRHDHRHVGRPPADGLGLESAPGLCRARHVLFPLHAVARPALRALAA